MGKQICVSLDGVEVYEDEEAYEVEQLKKHASWLEKELDKQRHKKVSCQIHIGELEVLCKDMYQGFWRYFAEAPNAGEHAASREALEIKKRMAKLGLLEGEH